MVQCPNPEEHDFFKDMQAKKEIESAKEVKKVRKVKPKKEII